MRTLVLLFLAARIMATAADAPPDVLRLTDGELAGKFAGITAQGVVKWTREDSPSPLEFQFGNIRHIVLKTGSPRPLDTETARIDLSDGNQITGKVVAFDGMNLTVDSQTFGHLTFPSERVLAVSPSPFGGRLIYAGPFGVDDWEIWPPAAEAAKEEEAEKKKKEEEIAQKLEEAKRAGLDAEKLQEIERSLRGQEPPEEQKKQEIWQHSAARWYFTAGNSAIRNHAEMPANSVFRFHLDWRARPSLTVALYADFYPGPEAKEDENKDAEEKQNKAKIVARSRNADPAIAAFGNCLLLTIRNNFATLQHCGYDTDGNPFNNRLQTNMSNIRLDNVASADFELRTNTTDHTVSLFANGSFVTQWQYDMAENYMPLGKGFGFINYNSADHGRLSDILIAEWNGMPDAARSFESGERDTLLMNNGTDRFSGKVQSIADGVINVKGPYAEFRVPLSEVAELHFAREREKTEAVEYSAEDEVKVVFMPLGRIHGKVVEATGDKLTLESQVLGRLSVNLDSATVMEFRKGGTFLQEWDEDL